MGTNEYMQKILNQLILINTALTAIQTKLDTIATNTAA